MDQQALNFPNISSPGMTPVVLFHWAMTSGRWRVETSKLRLAMRSLSPHKVRTRVLRVFSAGYLHGSRSQVLLRWAVGGRGMDER